LYCRSLKVQINFSFSLKMATLGPYSQSLGLTEMSITENQMPVLNSTPNGLVLELKRYCDIKGIHFIETLCKINPNLVSANPLSIDAKLRRIKDKKKKLLSKKKLKGFKNKTELLAQEFKIQGRQCKISERPDCDAESTTPLKDGISKSSSKDFCAQVDPEFEPHCQLSLKYRLRVKRSKRTANVTSNKMQYEKEQDIKLKARIGHYSIRNVNKRDETARKNLHKLRVTQRLVLKQQKLLARRNVQECDYLAIESKFANLERNMDSLNDSLAIEKAKNISLLENNSYLRMEIRRLQVNTNEKESGIRS